MKAIAAGGLTPNETKLIIFDFRYWDSYLASPEQFGEKSLEDSSELRNYRERWQTISRQPG